MKTPSLPTPQQAEAAMLEVTKRTHKAVAHYVVGNDCYDRLPKSMPGRYRGYCGFAQSVAHFILTANGITAKPVRVRDDNPGHVALTAEVMTTEGMKYYLHDTTYIQFYKDGPALTLQIKPEREYMLKALCNIGFVELTPQRAASYLIGFHEGKSVCATNQDAMDFLINPAPHPMNLAYSREELIRNGNVVCPPLALAL